MAVTQAHTRLSINGLGWGLSAAFAILFVLCMLIAWFMPMRAAHALSLSLSRARKRERSGWFFSGAPARPRPG